MHQAVGPKCAPNIKERLVQLLSRAFHFFIFTVFFVSVSIHAVAQSSPPSITSVDHASMPVGGRQCVNGTGFGSFEGNSTFTLNGAVLNTAVSWSDSQFCFQVPAATTPGTATVQLTTTNGTSNGLSFTLTPPPVINDITPARGAPGSQVTITGTNFGATQDNSYIQFDSTARS